MKISIILCLAFLTGYTAVSQDTTAMTHLKLNRSIWFYPNKVSLSTRYTVPGLQDIFFRIAPGETYYPALHRKRSGFVEATQVSSEYQNFGLKSDFLSESKVEPSIDLEIFAIREAGAKIRRGANSLVIGTLFALAGAGAGILVGQNDTKLGNGIAIGGGALGFLITITGYSTLASGGKTLQGYKKQ